MNQKTADMIFDCMRAIFILCFEIISASYLKPCNTFA